MSYRKLGKLSNKVMLWFFLGMIIGYQKVISPLIPARCRYYPTCSQYGFMALRWHGIWRGILLTSARIARCHPWGGSGVDFVALPLYRYHFYYLPTNDASQLAYGYGVYVDENSYRVHLSQYLESF